MKKETEQSFPNIENLKRINKKAWIAPTVEESETFLITHGNLNKNKDGVSKNLRS